MWINSTWELKITVLLGLNRTLVTSVCENKPVAFLFKWQMLILSLCSKSKVQNKLLGKIWWAGDGYLREDPPTGPSTWLLHVSCIWVWVQNATQSCLFFNHWGLHTIWGKGDSVEVHCNHRTRCDGRGPRGVSSPTAGPAQEPQEPHRVPESVVQTLTKLCQPRCCDRCPEEVSSAQPPSRGRTFPRD